MRARSLRAANGQLVLDLLRGATALTRAELAELTSLTPQALGPILHDLTRDGLVSERVGQRSGPGRRPAEYLINPTGALRVTIVARYCDLALVVVDSMGAVMSVRHLRHEPATEPTPLLELAFTQLRIMLDEAESTLDRVVAADFVLEGRVDEAHLIVHETPAWRRRNANLAQAAAPHLAPGVTLTLSSADRASAANALTQVSPAPDELVAILQMGHDNQLLLAHGGQILSSRSGRNGNLSHLPVPGVDHRCPCGRTGCLGTVSSGRAVLANYHELSGERLPAAVDVITRVGRGDRQAIEAVRRSTVWLGVALAPILATLDPDRLIITGAVGTPNSRGVLHLTHAIRAQLPPELSEMGIDVVQPRVSDYNLSFLLFGRP